MVIERLQALETVVDRLAAATERANDPLQDLKTDVALLHIKQAHQELVKDSRVCSPFWYAPRGFRRMPCDMSCPKLQAHLRASNVQLWHREYDSEKFYEAIRKFSNPTPPEEMEAMWEDETKADWYIAFNGKAIDSDVDEVSTWKRVV